MQEVGNIQQWACKKRMKLDLSKTWEMVLRGKTTKQVPNALPSIVRKPELKLLAVTFNQHPCNWETHFDLLLSKAILRARCVKWFYFHNLSVHDFLLLCGACDFLCNISRMNSSYLLFSVFTIFYYGLQLLNTFCPVFSRSAANYR